MSQKAANGKYLSIEDLWSDIKWIDHNTKVHRASKSNSIIILVNQAVRIFIHFSNLMCVYFTDDAGAIEATKWLINFTKGEIYTIRLCHECYWRANKHQDNWFIELCTKPHLLVWAKQKGFPYWVAKLMAVDCDKQTVDVQFFGGGHERLENFSPKDCYMYSKINPTTRICASMMADLNKACHVKTLVFFFHFRFHIFFLLVQLSCLFSLIGGRIVYSKYH